MCGRYSLFASAEEIESRFDASFSFEFEPRYNAAPGQSLPVIADADPDRIRRFEWGFTPAWADNAEGHINARSETIEEKPAFADAYESRRCLVPADGFYEWTDRGDRRQPHRVAYHDDRVFAMAGIWERWTPKTEQTGLGAFVDGEGPSDDPEPIETFAILTTEPNGVVEPLHHRMAVILDPEADEERRWLEGEAVSFDPPAADPFHSYPVGAAVNDPSNDRPELIEPLET